MEDLTGKQFGPYRVVAPLGEGGMAAVYRAYQASMDRYVALKVLPQYFARDPEFVGRFAQEARVLAKLQHVHILPVHDFGEADNYTYIVMPFVQTGTLADLLDSEPLPMDQIEKIVSQVGSALDYAHSEGVIHRDVKPSNILIDQLGNCLLTDFGIAKIVEGTSAFTQTGGILGTPAYMSPEQIRGETLDGRSDIYSLGVVLYEMATGRPPFKAETPPAIFVKHLHDPLPPPHIHNSEIPQGVERVILKALCKEREDRFDTMAEMVHALSRGVADVLPTALVRKEELELPAAPRRLPSTEMGVPATRVRKEKKERKALHLPKWAWGAAGGLLLLATVLALVLVFAPRDDDDKELTRTSLPPTEEQEDLATRPAETEVASIGAEEGGEEGEGEGDEGEALYQEGLRLGEQGDWVGALALLNEAIATGFERGELYHDRGIACRQLEEDACSSEQELESYSAAINLGLDSPGVYRDRGWAYANLGEAELAIEDFNRLIELEPDGPHNWTARGEQYLNLGEIDAGLADWARAVELEPDNPDLHSSLGWTYLGLGDPNLALDSFDRAIELAPNDPWSWRGRGQARQQMGDLEGALEDHNRAIELGPEDIYYFFDRGWVYWEMGETELAMADWDAAIEWEPENPDSWIERGWHLLELGETQRALDDFNQAIELDPESGSTYHSRASAYWEMGDGESALADMSRAVELEPDDAWVWYQRGVLLRDMGDYHAALENMDRAVSLGAQESWFYSDRAWLFWENLGEPELAIADWTAAIEMDSGQPWHYWDRAWAYSDLGNWDAARSDFQAFLDLTESEPEEYADERSEAQSWLADN